MKREHERRLARLEQQHQRGCGTCRHWVGAVLIDDDGQRSRPEWCPDCGRHALVPCCAQVHIVGIPIDVP